MPKKLGRPTDQRMAMLRNQVSELFWYGKIETTLDRAKSVKRLAEKLLTLAVKTYTDEVTVTKNVKNAKGEVVPQQFKNDGAKKLAARRKLMSFLRDLQEVKLDKEKGEAFRARTKDIKHPLIEKIFNEYAPKYAQRAQELGQGGGYTRIIKLGERRGDAAKMVIVSFV